MKVNSKKAPLKTRFLVFLTLLLSIYGWSQHQTNLVVKLDDDARELTIEQEITFVNTSDISWDKVYLLDWANAFSNLQTPLAIRLAEDFKNRFEFSSDEDKGFTDISSLNTENYIVSRPKSNPDVVILELLEPIAPQTSRSVNITYKVKIPLDDFTGYGKSSDNEYLLKYWYLHPAPFVNGEWQFYSHKDLNDFYGAPTQMSISVHVPSRLKAISSLKMITQVEQENRNSYLFEGLTSSSARLYFLESTDGFKRYSTNQVDLTTDIDDESVPTEMKVVFIDRIASFLNDHVGKSPSRELFISDKFYKENPVYGLSSLPSFINPFPAGFTYEIKMLKALTRKWVEQGISTHNRDEYWLKQGIIIHTIMKYQEQYYPNLKIGGKLSDFWGIRGFNVSQLRFNDRYAFLYLNTKRLNLDQAPNTPADSLLKYNQQLAIPFKAAIGLAYLNDYLGNNAVENSIKKLYSQSPSNSQNSRDFQKYLNEQTDKEIDWFFDYFITRHERLDWKLRNIEKYKDSVIVTIKNKSVYPIPIPIYALKNDSIVYKEWINGFIGDTSITLSRKAIQNKKLGAANRIVVNYEEIIPEFNPRDNYKTLKPFPAFNRPLEFRLFKDIEDPEKSQVFLMPDITFNIYDGLAIGSRFYNGNLLSKPFRYSIKPAYGTNSGKLVGSIGLSYEHPFQDRNNSLFSMRYGLSANQFSYAPDLLYRRGSAWLSFNYRPKDLRSNKRQSLNFRNVFVQRDRNDESLEEDPDYNVFALSFNQSDRNLRRSFSYSFGTEISERFSKASFRLDWRRLYKDNRQLNFRVFMGTFLYNDTRSNDDFFSFALDRPTDYLFDYNYYGRSEDDGLFSQQLILAEGGFKAQLDPAFANQWITTLNSSYSIWKYIFVYGDVGAVKNKGTSARFVYDTGIRLNLLQDYFELYFPVYNNNGWEIAQPNYDEKIRFIVTLDVNTFIGLFTRRWY